MPTSNRTHVMRPLEASNVEYLGRVYPVGQVSPQSKKTYHARRLGSARGRTLPDVRLPETGFLRLPEVLALFPVSRSRWWAGVKEGRFPAAIKLGTNTTAWRAEDIRNLIHQYGASAIQQT